MYSWGPKKLCIRRRGTDPQQERELSRGTYCRMPGGQYTQSLVKGSIWREAACSPVATITVATHTHTRLTALFPGQPRSAGTRKVKPIWILLKQETVSGSGISWAICKSAPCSRQTTMPASHRSVFLTGRMPFLPPNQQRMMVMTD